MEIKGVEGNLCTWIQLVIERPCPAVNVGQEFQAAAYN
jgi:hypothetical protein